MVDGTAEEGAEAAVGADRHRVHTRSGVGGAGRKRSSREALNSPVPQRLPRHPHVHQQSHTHAHNHHETLLFL